MRNKNTLKEAVKAALLSKKFVNEEWDGKTSVFKNNGFEDAIISVPNGTEVVRRTLIHQDDPVIFMMPKEGGHAEKFKRKYEGRKPVFVISDLIGDFYTGYDKRPPLFIINTLGRFSTDKKTKVFKLEYYEDVPDLSLMVKIVPMNYNDLVTLAQDKEKMVVWGAVEYLQ